MNPAVADITETAYNSTFQTPWLGTVDADRAWWWIDNFLILVRPGFRVFFFSPVKAPLDATTFIRGPHVLFLKGKTRKACGIMATQCSVTLSLQLLRAQPLTWK